MKISEAPVGSSFKVIKVLSGGEVGKRLADMGFTEGAEGSVVRSSFLRGPVHVRIRGYDLILRRSEAERIEVEPVGEWPATSGTRGIGRFRRRAYRGLGRARGGSDGD